MSVTINKQEQDDTKWFDGYNFDSRQIQFIVKNPMYLFRVWAYMDMQF